MQIYAETERLILREIIQSDDAGMFELDSDPEVHRYLGNKPVQSIELVRTVIEFIRMQYLENGIGRWAVIRKSDNAFLGWAGLKLMTEPANNMVDHYDVGYRLVRKYWGNGYATEAAKASISYGFNVLKPDALYAMAASENTASRKVLEKSGLQFKEQFRLEGVPHDWFSVARDEWSKGPATSSVSY